MHPDLQERARRCVKLAASLSEVASLATWLLDDARGTFEKQAAELLQVEKIAQLPTETADRIVAGEVFLSAARAMLADAKRRRTAG